MKGLWAWVLQRISSVLLIVLLGTHLFIMHFVNPLRVLDFAGSSFRLQALWYLIVDSALLAVGLFHGLNGIRNIIGDYWPRLAAGAAWVLGLIGLVAAGYGSNALYLFLTTK